MVFILGVVFPAALFGFMAWLMDFPTNIIPGAQIYPLFGLLVEYAIFGFCLAVLCAMLTSNPYSASGHTLLVLAALTS